MHRTKIEKHIRKSDLDHIRELEQDTKSCMTKLIATTVSITLKFAHGLHFFHLYSEQTPSQIA